MRSVAVAASVADIAASQRTRKAERPHLTVRGVLFLTGTRSACHAKFELIVIFLRLIGLSDRL